MSEVVAHYVAMPLAANVPTPRAADWKRTICRICEAECWRAPAVAQVESPTVVAVCTNCALRGGLAQPDYSARNTEGGEA